MDPAPRLRKMWQWPSPPPTKEYPKRRRDSTRTGETRVLSHYEGDYELVPKKLDNQELASHIPSCKRYTSKIISSRRGYDCVVEVRGSCSKTGEGTYLPQLLAALSHNTTRFRLYDLRISHSTNLMHTVPVHRPKAYTYNTKRPYTML